MTQTWGIILILYGVLCAYILLAKPNIIWKMKKFEVMIDMMGERGFKIFLTIWTIAALAVGFWLYNK
jgi:hypothetical protein